MALTRIVCPECGAGLKSSSGFSEGKNVCCPKCETYFAVENPEEAEVEAEDTPRKKRVPVAMDDEGDDDDFQPKKKKKKKKKASQSYQNSPLRYAILGVLVAVALILGVFLILKKTNEAKEQRANAESSPEETRTSSPQPGQSGEKKKPPAQQQQFPPVSVPEGTIPASDPEAQALRAQLIGKWKSFSYDPKSETEIMTVEYKNNDEFSCTITDKAKNTSKAYQGRWKVYFAIAIEPGAKPIALWLGFLIDVPSGTPAFTQLSVSLPDKETLDQVAIAPNNRNGKGSTVYRLSKMKE